MNYELFTFKLKANDSILKNFQTQADSIDFFMVNPVAWKAIEAWFSDVKEHMTVIIIK